MELILTRDLHESSCELGLLAVGGAHFQTIELPWRENQHGISCVPYGKYQLERHSSDAHPRTWGLINEELHVTHYPLQAHPDWRSLCLIHSANWARQLQGCIAPGKNRTFIDGLWKVENSLAAFQTILALVPWTNEHTLEIRRAE